MTRWMACLSLGLFSLVSSAAVHANAGAWRALLIDGHPVRWQRPADLDKPLVLTWRVAQEGQTYADAMNCRRIAPPRQLLEDSGLGESTFRAELAAAFQMWEQAANISFEEAAPGGAADITIGAQVDPVGRAFADVAYDRAATGATRAIRRSLICLNPRLPWKIGFDGNLEIYDLRFTLAHEIGHAIGLDHPARRGTLMGFSYDERSRSLERGDIEGAATIYGPPRQRWHLSQRQDAD